MKKKMATIAVGAGAMLLLSGCGSSGSGAGGEESAPITVYCAMQEPDCDSVLEAFKADTGIGFSYVRLGAGEILARVSAEKSRPQASLWLAGAADGFISAAGDGLLEPYEAEGIGDIDEVYRDPEDNWTPISTAPLAFAQNKELAQKLGVEPPTAWEDLADPKYEGLIALADPASSGTAFVALSTLVQKFGEDQAFELLKQIDKNVVQYTKSGSAPTTMAGMGEIALGIGFIQDVQAALIEGYPLTMSFPEGTGYELNAAALIAGGPEKQMPGAKKFLDWVITEKGQQAMADTHRLSLIEGIVDANSQLPEGLVIDTIDYDPFWSGENRDRLLERYQSEIRRGAEG